MVQSEENNSKDGEAIWRSRFVGRELVGLAIAILAIGIYFILSTPQLESVFVISRQLAPILTGLGGLGTLILAVLYWQQSKTLKDQTEIQNRQTEMLNRQTKIQEKQEKILAVNHKPNLLIDRWLADGDEIIINITNIGNGDATDLGLIVQVEGRMETAPDSDRPWVEPTADYSIIPLERTTYSEESLKRVIAAGEKNVELTTEAFSLKTWEGEPPHFEMAPFVQAAEEIRENGYVTLFLRISITYSDMIDEDNEIEILRCTSEIEEGQYLEDFLSQGGFSFKLEKTHKLPENMAFDEWKDI